MLVIIWVTVKNALLMYPSQPMANMLLILVEFGILLKESSYYFLLY